MITQAEAARIAEQIAGAPADDPSKGWTLEEFDHGWLIHEKATIGLMGSGARVVEKESGRVMNFGSAIGPELIREKYVEMQAEGFQEYPSSLPPSGGRIIGGGWCGPAGRPRRIGQAPLH